MTHQMFVEKNASHFCKNESIDYQTRNFYEKKKKKRSLEISSLHLTICHFSQVLHRLRIRINSLYTSYSIPKQSSSTLETLCPISDRKLLAIC